MQNILGGKIGSEYPLMESIDSDYNQGSVKSVKSKNHNPNVRKSMKSINGSSQIV